MKKSLAKNSLYNIAYKAFTALYPLLAGVYISHVLQADRVGVVSYAQNIVSYFAIIAALGIPIYGIREIAIQSADLDGRSKLFWELFTINFISTTVALVAYMVVILSVEMFSRQLPLYIVAGLQIALNYLSVDWFYQGIEEYRYITLRSTIVKLISLAALPIFITSINDYIRYALICCLAIAGNNIFNVIHLRKYIRIQRYPLNLPQHIKPIFMLWMTSLAVEIYCMIDTSMLGVFCDNTTVGCYANAMKLTRVVNSIAAACGAVLFPRLSMTFAEGDKQKFNELVNSGVKLMLMLAVPAAFGIIFQSENIVYALFGSSFAGSIPILRILALMVPIVVCNTLMGGQVLVTANRLRQYMVSVSTASVTNVILNALLIPRFGATSAASASLIAEVVALILYLWFSKDFIHIKLNLQFWSSILIPLLIYATISYYLISPLSFPPILDIIINIPICIILYFGIGVLLNNEAIMFAIQKVTEIFR